MDLPFSSLTNTRIAPVKPGLGLYIGQRHQEQGYLVSGELGSKYFKQSGQCLAGLSTPRSIRTEGPRVEAVNSFPLQTQI